MPSDCAQDRPHPTSHVSFLKCFQIFCVIFFSYDYSGYGASAGKPSEKNLYADIEAAWGALRSRYGVSLNLEY